MSEKFGYEQWKKMTIQLNRTKQITEQMSKFYIIAHEKVKAIMRKCQINPLYDPTEDSKNQLDFIKQVLVRLAHRNEDQYLSKIDPSSLDKYQRSFHDLLDLLHLVLHTHKSQSNLEISKLMRLTQDKDKKKSQYGLIGELKKSQHRVIRSKSGSRLSNHRASVNQQYNYANGAETQREKSSHSQLLVFPSAKTHIKQYLERKTNLEGIISKQIEKQGMGVSYEKKYRDNNFQEYFNHRKEFMELILSQKYYQNLTKVAQNRQNQSKVSEKNEQNLNKLFPDFNIKTKYMKRQVRENIMQVIFDVKKQILKEFHESNVKKMKEDSEQKMGQKKQSKRRVFKKSVSTTFIPEPPRSSLDDCPRFQSTNRKMSDRSQLPQKRRSSLFLKYEPSKQIVDPVWKKGEGVVQMQKRAGSVLNANKIPSYPL